MKEWFTPESLLTLAGSALAIRLVVEYTKDDFDTLWQLWTGKRPRTFIYALAWSYLLLYGLHALTGQLTLLGAFVDIFNGVLLAVTTGVLEKPTPK